jgi:hypothetical protein
MLGRAPSRLDLLWGVGLLAGACSDGARDWNNADARAAEGGAPDESLVGLDASAPSDAPAMGPSPASSDSGVGTIDVPLKEDAGAQTTPLDAGSTTENLDSNDSGVTRPVSTALDASGHSEADASPLTTTAETQTTYDSTTAPTDGGLLPTDAASDANADGGLPSGDAGERSSTDSGTSSATSMEVDAGIPRLDAGDAETSLPITITVSATGTSDWVGFPIVLGATGEASDASELTFSWEFVAVPDASEVDDGSLETNTSNARFNPDVAGDYVLRVTATSGEVSDTDEITVRADAFDVGYLNVAGDDDSWTRAGFMVRSDGTNRRQVGCYFPGAAASESDWLDAFQGTGQFEVSAYLPPNTSTPARLAYSYEVSEGAYSMYIAGSETDCSTNPPPEVVGGLIPSFNPGGERVSVRVQAEVTTEAGTDVVYGIHSYNVDGSDMRVVRTPGAASLWGSAWVDAETLLWLEADPDVKVYRAQDVDGAFESDLATELVLDCSTAINPLPTLSHPMQRGNFLYVQSMYEVGLFEIWRLGQVAGGAYDCELDSPSNERIVAGDVRDFDVSPDGTLLTYFMYFDATSTDPEYTQLFLRNLDGASDPIVLSAELATVASGAHFAAGGRQIVWTETRQALALDAESETYSRPEQSRVMIANVNGQNKRVLASVSSSSNQVRAMHTGSNGSLCWLGGNLGASGRSRVLAAALGLSAILFTGRRPRRNIKPSAR